MMILIDALYINNSGGLRLLQYLVNSLLRLRLDFYLLSDIRCNGIFKDIQHVRYMKASMRNRKRFYQKEGQRFTKVLCFGNIPVPLKLEVPVYTYFHNINLLTLSEAHSFFILAKSWLKREVFKHYKKNTDYWLVQTSNTANELIKHLVETQERVKLMPFYELPKKISFLQGVIHGYDYVYISTYVPGKGHDELLEAWRILHQLGIDVKLHLTVPFECHTFIDRITRVQAEGVNVVNHGLIPFKQVIELYGQSKAIVYPSHNESLGLGIVEALEAGCDVIASDLPFAHSICKPSVTFNPFSPESIADAIIEYEKGGAPKSVLLINNQIDDLMNLLVNK